MLAQQEPFPAVAVDRRWNLLKANQGAVRLVEFLVGPLAPGAPVNLADALVAPTCCGRSCSTGQVVRYFIRSVEADAAADGTAETAALLERLLAYDGVRPLLKALPDRRRAGPVLRCISARAMSAAAVHHDRHAGDAAGHHAAGTAHRMLLPHGRRDGEDAAHLGGNDDDQGLIELAIQGLMDRLCFRGRTNHHFLGTPQSAAAGS